MSHNDLPVYLRPCFLYVGAFPEDIEICASELIGLWVAEGFTKPIIGKSLEEIAEGYLEELVDRNLILVEECNYYGKLKSCKIHDLLRDLSLREARKQKIFCVLEGQSLDIPQDTNTQRRILINQPMLKKECRIQLLHALETASLARSVIWVNEEPIDLPSFRSRFLRISSMINQFSNCDEHSLEAILRQVHLRYLSLKVDLPSCVDLYSSISRFPSSLCLLWNLQTLIVDNTSIVSAPSGIWKMPQLRQVVFCEVVLPDPSSGHMDGRDDIVLENLQTLSTIYKFKCSEEVIKRIPNIKKLKISYEEGSPANYRLNNVGHLHKLESLCVSCCGFSNPENVQCHLLQSLTFTHNLKKLTLRFTHLHWEDLTTKIGSLPLLEVLKLQWESCIGPEWETVEGQFCSLKSLLFEFCEDLEYWTTDGSHFPRLVHLVLVGLKKLKEIPLSIGDIPTLELIQLQGCGDSAVDSAKRIREEQEELGNEALEVLIY